MKLNTLAGLSLFAAIGLFAWLRRAAEVPVPASSASAMVVDSAMARDESLRRFRVGAEPVESLLPVAASREELVRRFVRAVESRDSTALGALLLSRAEFAWLFYPSTPQGLPPYDLAPELMWDLLSRQSDRGIAHVLRKHGGQRMDYLAHRCDSAAVEGRNRIWGPCLIRRSGPGGDLTTRLTGPIIERDGRFKFVSYTNDED